MTVQNDWHSWWKLSTEDRDLYDRYEDGSLLANRNAAVQDYGHGMVFDENEQYTDVYHKAVARSLEDLPDLLGVGEKLGLITLFVRMCYADGTLHPLEAELIKDSAEMLGLSPAQLDAHLQPLFS